MVEIYYKETGRVKSHPEGARSATKPEQTGGLPGCTLAPANMPRAGGCRAHWAEEAAGRPVRSEDHERQRSEPTTPNCGTRATHEETGRVKDAMRGADGLHRETRGLLQSPSATALPEGGPKARLSLSEPEVRQAVPSGRVQTRADGRRPRREPFGGERCARCAGPLGLAVNGICPACRQGVRRVPAEAMLREAEKAHARHEGMSPALDRLTEGRIRMLKARTKDAPPRRGGERESS